MKHKAFPKDLQFEPKYTTIARLSSPGSKKLQAARGQEAGQLGLQEDVKSEGQGSGSC